MNEQIIYIAVENLVFDPENPRLPHEIRAGKNEPDYEKNVISWMLQFENVIELMGSIGEKGYFAAEPILVVPSAQEGKYEVVEGNRRLTALKLLSNPGLATHRKNTIQEIVQEALVKTEAVPCIQFGHRNDVLAYLAYKHITGVQPWDSLAKARYLKQLQATMRIFHLQSNAAN